MLARETGAAFQIVGLPHRLKPDKELALYRIAQESLNNARRHANAQNISLELKYAEAEIILCVCDDGGGFEIPPTFNELTRTGHFGLMGMRERVQIVGGQLKIISSPSQGTVVTVTMPT
jgi:two-component system, NarL family, sensor histidine kinase DegS